MNKYINYLIFSLVILFSMAQLDAEVYTIQVNRKHEVIMIDAGEFSSLVGQDIESIKMYRFLSIMDKWEPIPFQIDEFEDFSYSSKQSGVLESSDKILFLAKDLGDKASIIQWVDDVEAGNHKRITLIAVDPLTQDTGFAYIYLSRDLTDSGVQYLSYNKQEDFVESADYFISHGKYGLQDSILFKSSCGGDNIDFFDTQKLRFKIKIIVDLGILGKIKKTVLITEETRNKTITIVGFPLDINFKNTGIEYSCTGTIRLQRAAIFEIRVDGDGIGVHESSEIYLKTYFFPYYVEWSAEEITIPEFDKGKIQMMRFSADLNENSTGMMFYNKYNTSGVRIDGISSSIDTTIEWDYNWYLIHADPEYSGSDLTTGSILSIMDLKGSSLGDDQEMWFCDDASYDSDDTGDKRCFGDIGVQITGNSISGQLSFLNRTYYVPENLTYTEAEEKIEKDKHPLEISSQSHYPLHITVIPLQGGQVEVETITDSTRGQSIVKVTAVPADNYEFDFWSGDYSGTVDTLQITMDNPKYITAHFIRLREITVTTNPPGMDFFADHEIYTAPHSFHWREESSHELRIDSLMQPHENFRYIFSEWSTGEARYFNYMVPEYDELVTADFITEFRVYTTVNLEEAGSVIITPSGEWFEQGSQLKFEAFPQGWYTFIRWSGDLDQEENPVTVSVDSSLTVQAIFGNYPPLVVLPDTSFNEDDTLTLSFDTFDQWISDMNNPDSTLKVYFQGGNYITLFSDSSIKEITIFSKNSNWYGIDSLQVKVEDPLKETGQDYLVLEVNSVNDAPQPFSLVEPADDSEITECADFIHFKWQSAADPDPGDSVKYVFELDTTLDFDSSILIRKDDLKDISYKCIWPDFYQNSIYYWQVTAVDTSDSTTKCEKIFSFYLNTSAVEQTATIPDRFILQQNFPNPFNHSTVIGYGLPEAKKIGLCIMNNQGQKVCTLINRRVEAGYHTVNWNGKDENNRIVSSGIYFIVFTTEESWFVKKALFLK